MWDKVDFSNDRLSNIDPVPSQYKDRKLRTIENGTKM